MTTKKAIIFVVSGSSPRSFVLFVGDDAECDSWLTQASVQDVEGGFALNEAVINDSGSLQKVGLTELVDAGTWVRPDSANYAPQA